MPPSPTAQLLGDLLYFFEGEKFKAYQDSGGVWTIGFGHTRDVTSGMVCTHEQAVEWLSEDSAPLLALVNDMPTVKAAALASFGYNTGIGNLKKALVNLNEIADPVHTTDRHSNVLPGLVARRRLEFTLAGA